MLRTKEKNSAFKNSFMILAYTVRKYYSFSNCVNYYYLKKVKNTSKMSK